MVPVGVQRLRRSCRGRDEKVQSVYEIEATVTIASNRDHLRMSGLLGADVQLQSVRTGAKQNKLPKRTYTGSSKTRNKQEDSDLH